MYDRPSIRLFSELDRIAKDAPTVADENQPLLGGEHYLTANWTLCQLLKPISDETGCSILRGIKAGILTEDENGLKLYTRQDKKKNR